MPSTLIFLKVGGLLDEDDNKQTKIASHSNGVEWVRYGEEPMKRCLISVVDKKMTRLLVSILSPPGRTLLLLLSPVQKEMTTK